MNNMKVKLIFWVIKLFTECLVLELNFFPRIGHVPASTLVQYCNGREEKGGGYISQPQWFKGKECLMSKNHKINVRCWQLAVVSCQPSHHQARTSLLVYVWVIYLRIKKEFQPSKFIWYSRLLPVPQTTQIHLKVLCKGEKYHSKIFLSSIIWDMIWLWIYMIHDESSKYSLNHSASRCVLWMWQSHPGRGHIHQTRN